MRVVSMDTVNQQIGGPKASVTAETGAAIQIDQLDHGGSVVYVTYPEKRRRKDVKVLRVVCSCLCLVPPTVWLFLRHGTLTWFGVLVSAIIAGSLIANCFRRFSAVTRSYVLRADHTGLTIEISNGRRTTIQHFTRGQVADIVLGFSFYRGPNSLFRCWLEVNTTTSSRIRCLQDVGGDHLARIANVLRAALRMPARSWP
jgi:hypothetical protein